jgi:hypothetical protein
MMKHVECVAGLDGDPKGLTGAAVVDEDVRPVLVGVPPQGHVETVGVSVVELEERAGCGWRFHGSLLSGDTSLSVEPANRPPLQGWGGPAFEGAVSRPFSRAR